MRDLSQPDRPTMPLALLASLWLTLGCVVASGADPKPLRVFILAGQSNMEGHAKVETFDYIGDDPATAPLLRQMRSEDGKPRVCDNVWISYFTGSGDQNGEGHGKLTAGYGSRRVPTEDNGKIGPEFTFGIAMDAAFDEPVLIIKTAWGGKSLHTDFRPPSAGPYRFNEKQLSNFAKQGKNISDDPQQGFVLSGFVWLQGWNDLVDSGTYPDRTQPGGYDAYSEVLTHFIRDVRRDLDAPKMPFVIGVLGVGGRNANPQTIEFRKAMAAPASLDEFRGNVVAVQTAPFWSEELGAIADKRDQVRQMSYFLDSKHRDHPNADGSMTPEQKRQYLEEYEAKLVSTEEAALWKRGASNAGYHYLGCAKTFAQMGQAFATATLDTLRAQGLLK
jgi:alpha-galactosidase